MFQQNDFLQIPSFAPAIPRAHNSPFRFHVPRAASFVSLFSRPSSHVFRSFPCSQLSPSTPLPHFHFHHLCSVPTFHFPLSHQQTAQSQCPSAHCCCTHIVWRPPSPVLLLIHPSAHLRRLGAQLNRLYAAPNSPIPLWNPSREAFSQPTQLSANPVPPALSPIFQIRSSILQPDTTHPRALRNAS